MPAANTKTITLGATSLEIKPTGSSSTELIPKEAISGVFPVKINSKPAAPNDEGWKYRFNTMVVVRLELVDGNSLEFDVQEVTNQATWVANLTGQQQCIADINAWLP